MSIINQITDAAAVFENKTSVPPGRVVLAPQDALLLAKELTYLLGEFMTPNKLMDGTVSGLNITHIEHSYSAVFCKPPGDAHVKLRSDKLEGDYAADLVSSCMSAIDFSAFWPPGQDPTDETTKAKIRHRKGVGSLIEKASAKAMGFDVDAVDHPPHYGGADNPFEAIKVIEAWQLNFCLGNALKYIARCDHKGSDIEDLEKARRYIDREIQRRKSDV